MRIAIVGAGPIGIEAATAATRDGHDVIAYETGKHVAASLAQYSHIRLFTPWSMNTTALGRSIVADPTLESAECPTVGELLRVYLHPLARWLDVRTGHRVKGIARVHLAKEEAINDPRRAAEPFRLLIEGPMGETTAIADVILDCSGLAEPSPAGPGGLPAPGEDALARAGLLTYGPCPTPSLQRRRVLVVGDGASATGVVLELLAAHAQVWWLTRSEIGPVFATGEDDPLVGRRRLMQAGQAALRSVTHLPRAAIERFLILDDGTVGVRLGDGIQLGVDRVMVCTGFRPDTRVFRDLQVRLCWGTEGPIALATQLLAADGVDCLAPQPTGVDLLRHPEPNFFVIGSKSYGRRTDFVLPTGHRQIDEVLAAIQR